MRAYLTLIKRHWLVALGLAGIVGACLFTFTLGAPAKVPANQLALPVQNPYEVAISATGLVESSSFNLKIGATDAGIITHMHVKEGQRVKKGDPLFTLDTSVAEKDLLLKKAQSKVAESQLKVALVTQSLKLDEWKRSENLRTGMVISESLWTQRRLAYEDAKARVTLAEHALEQAQAQVQLTETYLQRLKVKSPIEGKVLKIFSRVGELLQGLSSQDYGLLLGQDDPLCVRVQIDENDVWRFDEALPAKAYLRSQKDKTFNLKYVRIDPYASPKHFLNGDSRQLIDTRVVEVVYEIIPPYGSLIIGQQLDVYIQTKK